MPKIRRSKLYTNKTDPKRPTHIEMCPQIAYLAKHDFARAGVDNQLQGGSIDIEDHLAVGDASDGQPKPQRPIGHFSEGLCTHTQVMASRVS